MPLRDMMRGMGTLADATEQQIEPALTLLPGPVRALLDRARRAAGDLGARTLSPPPEPEDIARAAAWLRGTETGRDGAAALVRALAWGWRAGMAEHPFLFSETVAVAALAAMGDAGRARGGMRAAHILARLVEAHVVGHVPGAPITLSRTARETALRVFAAVFVWLLTERAGDVQEEAALMEMALALVDAAAAELEAAAGDPDATGAVLERLAGQL